MTTEHVSVPRDIRGSIESLLRRISEVQPPNVLIQQLEQLAEARDILSTILSLHASIHPDDVAVDEFAKAMKIKLGEARSKGRGGWNNKDDCPQQRLSDMLRDHVDKGDPRDVANFCMFLYMRGEAILPRATPSDANGESWEVRFICCGRDDGNTIVNSYAEADAIREAYTSGVGVNPHGYSEAHKHDGGHQRAAIVSRFSTSPKEPSSPRVVTDEDVEMALKAADEVIMEAIKNGTDMEEGSQEDAMRAALESFATSLPAAMVPDDYRKVTADALRIIVTCADEYRSAVRDVFALREDGKPYAERDTTKDSDAMWAFQRLNDTGARLIECCARIQPALLAAAPQAGERG